MKRDIYNFSQKICNGSSKSENKFVTDMIYGISKSKDILLSSVASTLDVLKIVRNYMNRWRIEEYFKFRKQEYNFENFRVRTLKSINNLNSIMTYTIGLIAMLSDKKGKREFVNRIIKVSKNIWNEIMY